MASQQDTDAINGLFDRLEEVAHHSDPRDREAEGLIQERLRRLPPAPYYMAQTILVQEEALRQARAKIEELESGSRSGGGFLGGLFDSGHDDRGGPARRRGPWDRSPAPARSGRGGGGFLAGAAQTALGVTGGVLLGSAIAGMFTGQSEAQDLPPEEPADTGPEDHDQDHGDFGGGDFDMGDF